MKSTIPDPAVARREAERIRRASTYRPRQLPHPLRAFLDWLGRTFKPIGDFFKRIIDALPKPLRPIAWLIVIAAAIAVIYALVIVVRRRMAPGDSKDTARDRRERDAGARELEAEAEAAAARGDYQLAVRLRFRAGLLRLDRDAHAIEYSPSLANTPVRATIHQPAFDRLADSFEAVTYGTTLADPLAAGDAKTTWPVVVEEARR